MAEYIDREELIENLNKFAPEYYNALINLLITKQPAVDVEENKDCEKCIHFGKHATEYPCSHCRNCYTDKFQPNDTRTPKERGGEK